MATLNKVLLIGNLTRDPELRYTQGGAAVCKFSLAVNRSYTGKDGEKKEEVCFIDVDVWQKLAELCAEYLKKGNPAFVEGRLKQDSWEGKDGTKRTKILVVADNVQFLRAGGSRAGADAGGPPPEAEMSAGAESDGPRIRPHSGSKNAPPSDEPPGPEGEDTPF
ncbi:MAG: single-stranded DNA-binding protein [Planctomycetes bacterium]|nr:single-stranded DNA-binding protein [Planctomycetota bacterium]